jgi:hypothetical protein
MNSTKFLRRNWASMGPWHSLRLIKALTVVLLVVKYAIELAENRMESWRCIPYLYSIDGRSLDQLNPMAAAQR